MSRGDSHIEHVVKDFLDYIALERRYSQHTVLAYKNDISQFTDWFLEAVPSSWKDLNEFIVRSWMVELLNLGNTARTIHRKMSALNSFFDFLIKEEILDVNPCENIVKPKMVKKLPEIMREDEMLNLFEKIDFTDDFPGLRDKLILELLYGTGMRLSELISIKTDDIRNEYSSIKVLGKRNKERILPIHKELRLLLIQYLKLRGELLVEKQNVLLLTNQGKKLYPKFVYRLVNTYLSKVTSRTKKSPHVLRHSFATHLLNKGGDLNAVKELLGHANLAATEIYTHNSIEELKRVFNRSHPRGT